LYDLQQVAGEFDLINCGVFLHHLPDPAGHSISGGKGAWGLNARFSMGNWGAGKLN